MKLSVMYGDDSMATSVYQRVPRDVANPKKAKAVKTEVPVSEASPESAASEESAE